jgi:transcriptional regulator with GAF, ATPase, and Fis domain
MAEIELGLYHYKLIYSAISTIESSKNIKNAIPNVFDLIINHINPDVAIYFSYKENKIDPFISNQIEMDKIKNIDWKNDSIISTTLELIAPIKSDSALSETILKDKPMVLSGLGYKFDSVISLPIEYNKTIYGILLLLNKKRKFGSNEFETLKIISKQIGYHYEIMNLNEDAQNKCKYLTAIIDKISSAIIIYSEKQIKFINKKAKDIIDNDISVKEKIEEIIQEAYLKKTNLNRMEIEINGKIIGYSITNSKIDIHEVLIFIFQDITKFKN